MLNTIFITLFVSFSAYSSSVFLVEDETGKHVGFSSDGENYKLITSGSDWHLYPAISNDGSKIAYAKGSVPNDLRLVLRNLETNKEHFLTKSGFVIQPAFSNQGNKVFFSMEDGGINKIGQIDLAKSKQTEFITSKFPSFFPAPFQDGRRVIYQRNRSPIKKEIVLLDLNDKSETVIGEGMSPALSKDERFIAYTSKHNGNWDIFIYDRFQKKTTKVTNSPARDFSPSFDRFNNLIYTTDKLENGVFSIVEMKLDKWTRNSGESEIKITKAGVSFYAPKFSGEKKYILKNLPAMEGEAKSSFGTINHKGRIYTVGGHQGPEHTYPPESFSNRVSAFDIKSQKWLELAPKINKAHGFQLAAHGNYIYAFGGFAYEGSNTPKWKSISSVERYDISNNKWELMDPMPRNRSSNALAIHDNKVYLFGGWDATPKFENDIDGTFHDDIDVFDLKTEKWTTLTTKLPKKRRAFSAFTFENSIYLVGGISEGGSHFTLSDDFTKFEISTNTFTEMPKLPFGTFAPAAGVIGQEAFMFGGMFKLGKFEYEYVPHIYKFDFSENVWVHTGRYLKDNKGFSQVVPMKGNCLGILGGHSYKKGVDKPLNGFEEICLK